MSTPRDRIEAKLGLAGPQLSHLRDGPPRIPDHELIRRIGRGAYGEVWLARNALGTMRAVKIVYRDNFKDARPYEREFAGIRRFEPLSRSNEGFVDILQVGRDDAGGWFYYVMELADATEAQVESSELRVEGEAKAPDKLSTLNFQPSTYTPRTLSRDLQQCGRLPLDQCLELGLTLSFALGHLHRHGLIHRDIKPSNIIFVGGVPKLADIGLVTESEGANTFVGTEGFIPPEGPTSPQADLYALGKVLYEAAMGKDRNEFPEPFTQIGTDRESVALMELNAVLLRACMPDRKLRYVSAEEMHADLALLQSGKSVTRMRAIERRLRFVTRAAAAVAALAVLIAGGWFYQANQTRIVRRLAVEKSSLADENQRLAESQREQLIRVTSANGIQYLEADGSAIALPWLVEALRHLEGRDPQREKLHRLRLGTLLRYHPRLLGVVPNTGAVHSLAFSPNGRWIATGSDDGPVRIIDADTVSLHCVLPHTGAVHSVEFSRDSARLLTASADHFARVWNLSNRQMAFALAHKDAVRNATFSPDGEWILTASADRTAQVWRAIDGSPVGKPLEHSLPLFHACFSPDGRRIATGSGQRHLSGELRLWDRVTGVSLAPPVVLKEPATWTAFSPDGLRVASSCGEAYFDYKAPRPGVLVETATGHVKRWLEHVDRITHVAFSPDGKRLATAALGYELIVRDAVTGEPLIPPLKHMRWVYQGVFSPDGRWVASASSDGSARVWDASTGVPITPPLNHGGQVFCIAFDPDGRRLATAGDSGLMCLWDIGGSEPALPAFRHTPGETVVELTPDQRLALTSVTRRDDPLKVWELATGKQMWSFPNGDGVYSLRVSSTGDHLLTAGSDGYLRLWDLGTGQPLWAPLRVGCLASAVAFSPDGKRFAAGSREADWTQSSACIRDTATGRPLTPVLPHPYIVQGVEFSPDGRGLLTACWDGKVRLWDAASGELKRTFEGHGAGVEAALFSRDGSRIVSDGRDDNTARVWDSQTGQTVFSPLRHGGLVWTAIFDSAGERILTASQDLTAVQWDAHTGRRIDPPLQHRGMVYGATYGGADRLIATASADQSARLWSAASGELLAAPFRHSGQVFVSRLTRDGRRLLTSGEDGKVQVWDLAVSDWPVADLKLYAEVLSCQSLQPDGRLKTLGAQEIAARMRELRAIRPRDFELTPDQMQRWHRREKVDSQRAENAFAMEFHAHRTRLPDFD